MQVSISREDADHLLSEALRSARQGDKATARRLLWQALKLEPKRASGWLLLASVVESREDVQTCLHQVLYLDPANSLARTWIGRVEAWEDAASAPPPPSLGLESAEEETDLEATLAAEEPLVEPQAGRGGAQLLTLPARTSERPALSPVAAPEPPEPAAEPPAPADEPPRTKILVVDDSATVRRLVSIALERLGCEVIAVESGIEALSRIAHEDFQLVFLDIGLPHLDGYQVCKIIRTHAKGKHLPVVMLSGRDGFVDKVRGRLAGAVDYLTKPVDALTLRNAVTRFARMAAAEGH